MIVACIPAYNEEKTIAKVVLRTQKFVDKVIVCDDGSIDMTADIAESLGALVVRHAANMGKGATLRDLFDISLKLGAETVITLDGDGQHDPNDIPVVIRPVTEGVADVSVGGRLHENNTIPFTRVVGNKVLNVLTNAGNSHKIADTQSGFRAYSRRALEEIEVREDGMGVDSQILLEARKRSLKVSEAPISVMYGKGTSTHNSVRHLADVTMSIVRYAAEERPLLLLGLPGLTILSLGLFYGVLLLSIYANSREFIFAYALLSVGGTLMGVFSILVAVILYALSNLLKRLKIANGRTQ